jgi:hypothetical protein
MIGLRPIRCIEDRADVRSDLCAHCHRWHVLTGILLQVKLAAPRPLSSRRETSSEIAHPGPCRGSLVGGKCYSRPAAHIARLSTTMVDLRSATPVAASLHPPGSTGERAYFMTIVCSDNSRNRLPLQMWQHTLQLSISVKSFAGGGERPGFRRRPLRPRLRVTPHT